MAAILWIICCHNCSDNSTGRMENCWRETWNYLKWMVCCYLKPRPLHAASSQDLSPPHPPHTAMPLYNGSEITVVTCMLNARHSARLQQYAVQSRVYIIFTWQRQNEASAAFGPMRLQGHAWHTLVKDLFLFVCVNIEISHATLTAVIKNTLL